MISPLLPLSRPGFPAHLFERFDISPNLSAGNRGGPPCKVLESGEREREKCPRTFTFPAAADRERERLTRRGENEINDGMRETEGGILFSATCIAPSQYKFFVIKGRRERAPPCLHQFPKTYLMRRQQQEMTQDVILQICHKS